MGFMHVHTHHNKAILSLSKPPHHFTVDSRVAKRTVACTGHTVASGTVLAGAGRLAVDTVAVQQNASSTFLVTVSWKTNHGEKVGHHTLSPCLVFNILATKRICHKVGIPC